MIEEAKEFLVLLVALFLVSAILELIIFYAGLEPLMENKAVNFLRIFIQCALAFGLVEAYKKWKKRKYQK